MDQNNLLKSIVDFYGKSRPRAMEGKDKREMFMKVHMLFKKVEN